MHGPVSKAWKTGLLLFPNLGKVNRRPLIRAIDPDGEKGSFAAHVKILNSNPRPRVLRLGAALEPRRLSLTVARPAWSSFGVSVLLHAALVGALVLWAPARIARVVETYAVEIVTVPPSIAVGSQRSAVNAKKADPPPQPPEPKKESPPPKPDPVVVTAKPSAPPPAKISSPAPSVSAPLRIAVASAPAAQPTAEAFSRTAPSNTVAAATSGGNAEEVADPAYVNSVREAVAHHLRYPEPALRRGIEGRVVLRLTLTASGHLLQATASEPAADIALTNAALMAVHRAAPFPAWRGMHKAHALVCLTLPIRFKLDEK
jgi:protein TonB